MGMKLGKAVCGMALCGAVMSSNGALVAEWTFDEGSGTTVSNSVGSGYDGTLQGSTRWVTGHDGTGYALDFGGTNGNYVAVSTAGMLSSVSNQISIAFWAYGNDTMPQNTIGFQGQVGTSGRELQCHMPWADLSRIYWDAAGRYYFGHGDAPYLKGGWTYWVFTKNADKGTMNVYANGDLKGQGAGYGTYINGSGITRFAIGADNGGVSTYAGIMDDFKIYDHELTYEEIAIGFNPDTVVAQVESDESIGLSPLKVVFDASSSFAGHGIAEYLWDFGADPSNMVIGATGRVVTNTFETVGDTTVTLYVVDGLGVTNSTTTTIKVLDNSFASASIDLVAETNVLYSSEAFYGSSILYLLTDTFGYHPIEPTAFSPSLDYKDGFHGGNGPGVDVWLSFTNVTPFTTTDLTPVIVMDVWGRNYASAKNRDDDFDVVLYNGSWDAADIVGFVNGCGVDDSSNYTRAIINTLPIGTTFDRVRIVGHDSNGIDNDNAFTLTEVRLAAIAGEVVTVVAEVSATPESGYYPLAVSFDGSGSYAVESSGSTITDYLWDFGDGNTDSGMSTATNTYTASGLFTNTLSVVNSLGETNRAQLVINAMNPITAAVSVSTNTVYAGIGIVFDASATTNEVSDALVSYSWDFGGGNLASGMIVTNTLTTVGAHTVTLTVEDAAGRSNTATVEVTVLALPEIVISGGVLSWDTPTAITYEIQYREDLLFGDWLTYSNVLATPPTTTVELPLGRAGSEFFRVDGFK